MASTKDEMNKDLWHQRDVIKKDDMWTVEGKPNFSVQPVAWHRPPNAPGKSWITVLVTGPPGSATPPHTHNGASVFGLVVKGKVINQFIHDHSITQADGTVQREKKDSGVLIHGPGDSFFEPPGCHHVRSENAYTEPNGEGEEAQFYASFLIDSDLVDGVSDLRSALVKIDAAVEEERKSKA